MVTSSGSRSDFLYEAVTWLADQKSPITSTSYKDIRFFFRRSECVALSCRQRPWRLSLGFPVWSGRFGFSRSFGERYSGESSKDIFHPVSGASSGSHVEVLHLDYFPNLPATFYRLTCDVNSRSCRDVARMW